MQVSVPVRLAWTTCERGANKSEWVLDTKQSSQGVVVARSLLPETGTKAYVRAINLSDQAWTLSTGLCMGSTEPAKAVGERNFAASPAVGSAAPRYTTPPVVVTDESLQNSYSHVQPVVDGFSDTISGPELSMAKQLVYEYSDVFSRSEFDLGHCAALPHRIDTGNARPFKEQLRRHPIAHLDFIDNQVHQMLRAGVVEPCSSPWSSNVVLARKADGTLRFCVDYRRLNDLTYKDSFPLPRIDTCLNALGGSIYFSTIDLRSGFWPVAIDPRDADKTAFVTRKGQF